MTREFCPRCTRISAIGFYSPLWDQVAGRWKHSTLCIACFASLGDEQAIRWEEGLEFCPVSLVTHHAGLDTPTKENNDG